MKYRDGRGRYSYRENFENDSGADGSFEKVSDSVVYTWAPNRNAQKVNRHGTLQLIMASVMAAFLTFFLLLVPTDLDLGIVKKLSNLFSSNYVIGTILFIVSLAFTLTWVFESLNSARQVSSSFVDLDERSTDKRVDMKFQVMKDNKLELKSSRMTEESGEKDDAKADEVKTEFHELSAVEHYIHNITKSLDRHIELSEKKASKLLDTGTMYLRRGIYFYAASIFVWQVVAHAWGVNEQLIYGVVSCSLTFLVVEFLAAWFLKQYRSFIDSSIQFMRVKSVFDRYLLSYYAVKEFSNDGAAEAAESKAQVLKVLAEEIKWPEALTTKTSDMNHMVQMFDSLAGVLERVKKVSAKNEKAEA